MIMDDERLICVVALLGAGACMTEDGGAGADGGTGEGCTTDDDGKGDVCTGEACFCDWVG
jgi:hypothetical protein